MVLLCDGMADRPVDALGGKTPMAAAHKPHMEKLAQTAEVGLVKTVADGVKPGSDVANLSVMGYDPLECYTGRSPLEAASIGIDLLPTDVSLRCNLVTLSDEEDYRQKTMVDYCAGDISTEEARELIEAVKAAFNSDVYSFYAGVAYRHCLVVKNGTTELGEMTPPHDISGQKITNYLSDAPAAAPLIDMMIRSYQVLKNHPLNIARVQKGLRPANSIWLWGEGRKPALENFAEKYGKRCGVVSAVDLIKGIARCAGMDSAEVEGATGYLDTNFAGKAKAAMELLDSGCDLVYIHLEAPDECGHRGEVQNKVKAIEEIDRQVLGPMLQHLDTFGNYRVLILPDHPTPLEIKTHSSEPVPYLLYEKQAVLGKADTFTEESAAKGPYIAHGPDIMPRLLQK